MAAGGGGVQIAAGSGGCCGGEGEGWKASFMELCRQLRGGIVHCQAGSAAAVRWSVAAVKGRATCCVEGGHHRGGARRQPRRRRRLAGRGRLLARGGGCYEGIYGG